MESNVGIPVSSGADGADGVGVPPGGAAGQVLQKVDATDFNTHWATITGGAALTIAPNILDAVQSLDNGVFFDESITIAPDILDAISLLDGAIT